MNKLKPLLTAIIFTLISLSSFADFIDPDSSKKTDGESTLNVSDALNMKEGLVICLEGNITRKINKDYYMFKDDTGEIKVKIPRSAWNKADVTPNHTVRLYGKITNSNSLSRQRHLPAEIMVRKLQIVEKDNSDA